MSIEHQKTGTLASEKEMPMRMKEKLILNVVSRVMIPFILLFGFYVQFHGDFGPGGGFQAGVIFAAGLILYALVFGVEPLQRILPVPVVETAIALGLLIYAGVGVASLLLGGVYLDYDMLGEHGQHRGILWIEAGVGLCVASSMTRFYYAFAALSQDPDLGSELGGDSE